MGLRSHRPEASLYSCDGLCWSSALGDSKVRWAAYSQISATADGIYFYRGGGRGMIVPRRAFPSPEAAETFFQAAKEWHATAALARV